VKNDLLPKREKTLRQRAYIIQEIRQFFFDQDYLEVETPHLIPAPAPESYIEAVTCGEWFLQTSPELCMKRMLAAGYEKIFQICRCWRDRERGSQHIPEFTLLEWYRADSDYQALMTECQALILTVARGIGLKETTLYQGHEIDLTGPWERISVKEAFHRYVPISLEEALERDLFDEIMVRDIEPRLGITKPTFVYDYPVQRAALARLKQGDPSVAERFELYIGSVELANGFSELIDAKEQQRRFHCENENRRKLGKLPYPMPEKFLVELDHMPPSAGIALGVDRLVMVFSNAGTIDEVVAFTPEEL
jgi:elongation factor P--(R)-beta-lysine ligase